MTALTDKVDAIFAEWDKPDSPGCALAIIQDGQIIYKRGYGMANLEYDIPITSTSVFHIASISKQFAAMAIALLEQDGQISADDDIRKHLPEMPDYGHTITIRHLVHHTSGLRDQWELLLLAGWREDDLKTNDDVLYLASRQKELNFKPGDEYLYCNTGYTLMGIIVERVSGKTLRQFTDERIFKPLGMANTHFHDDHSMVVRNRAYGYLPRPEGGFRISIPDFDTVGATSLFTTVEDLALWEQNFYHKKVGGESVIELMLRPGKLNDGETLDYAFGVNVAAYKGLRAFGHSGADAGYRSDFVAFPDYRFAVIVFCNLGPMNPGSLTRKVADLYLADHLPQEAEAGRVELSQEEIASKAGLYRNARTGDTRWLDHKDGKLIVPFAPGFEFELTPLDKNRFKVGPFPIEIAFHYPENAPVQLSEVWGSGKPTIYEAVSVVNPTAEQLAEYVGTYSSDELETNYKVALKDGSLTLWHKKHGDSPLKPTVVDAFSGRGDLMFTRDAQNRVDGFNLFTGRIRKQRFAKESQF